MKTINLKLKRTKERRFQKVTAGGGDQGTGMKGGSMSTPSKGPADVGDRYGQQYQCRGFSFMDILNFTGELARMQRGARCGNININISGG